MTDKHPLADLFRVSEGMYFRRDGTSYKNVQEFAEYFEKGADDRRVALTRLWWGGTVSTVFLGLNHSLFGMIPLIFETMVFPRNRGGGELDMDRYHTEKQALEGHKRMVRAWRFPFFKKDFWRRSWL